MPLDPVTPIRFRCPELHDGHRAPVFGCHSDGPEFIADFVDRRACEHITEPERAELRAGRVPDRLAVTEPQP